MAISPDLVSTHNLSGFSISVWSLMRWLRIPVVHVLHDYYLICPHINMMDGVSQCANVCKRCKTFRLAHRPMSNRVDAVIGVSRAALSTHTRLGYFRQVKDASVIYNARHLRPLVPRPKKEGVFVFGYIGSLSATKGVERLLDAFGRLSKRIANPIELLMAGSGDAEYSKRLKDRAPANVSFLGHVAPAEFFAILDAFVVPSLWSEPFAGVVYEGLGYGVPVVASNRGGIPEVVRHEHNGLVFDPDVSDALEQSLERIATDPFLLSQLRLAAKDSVATFVDVERMTSEYESLYQRVVDRTSRKSA
jgi:glycosyltransferase involved in cell wall biosynthesis